MNTIVPAQLSTGSTTARHTGWGQHAAWVDGLASGALRWLDDHRIIARGTHNPFRCARPSRPGAAVASPSPSSTTLRTIADRSEYERDFYAWTRSQVAALADGEAAGLDIAHLIEEIDSLGGAQVNALRSRYFRLCVHLLKFAAQPDKASRSWLARVSHQRIEIARLLEASPSLKAKKDALFATAYFDARKQASVETGLDATAFPSEPTFTIRDAEAGGWLP